MALAACLILGSPLACSQLNSFGALVVLGGAGGAAGSSASGGQAGFGGVENVSNR